MKKIFAKVAVAVAIIVAFASVSFAWLSDNDTVKLPTSFGGSTKAAYFAGGDGSSADDAYKISNEVHMYNLAWLQYIGYFNYNGGETGVNNGLKQSYFELTADIDMSLLGSALPPIGTEEYPFIGNFNGNGHTISGLTVSNTRGDGNITKYPTNARFDANGMLDCADNSSKEVQIVGAFGVVGNYNKVVGYTLNDTLMNVKGFYLDGITVKTYSENTFVGLVAGEVSASLSDVGVGKSQINLSSSSVGLGDNGNVVSKYSIVGDYDAESVGWTTKPTGGGWGGSIDMKMLNRRITYMFTEGTVSTKQGNVSTSSIYNTNLSVSRIEYYWKSVGNNNLNIAYLNAGTVIPLNVDEVNMYLNAEDGDNYDTLSTVVANNKTLHTNAFYKTKQPEIVDKKKNTGYLVGASKGPRARIQKMYALKNSVNGSDTFDADNFTMLTNNLKGTIYKIKDDTTHNESSALSGYSSLTPSQLKFDHYSMVRENFIKTMTGSSLVHGFHFLNAINVSNPDITTFTPGTGKVWILGQDYSSYQFISGGLNFSTGSNDSLRVIAGSFYNIGATETSGSNALFDLFEVKRTNGTIDKLVKITSIYKNSETNEISYNSNTCNGEEVFNFTTINKGRALKCINAAYYYEIPVYAGDYVIGTDADTTNSSSDTAYLMYLDIGADGSTGSGNEKTLNINNVEFVNDTLGNADFPEHTTITVELTSQSAASFAQYLRTAGTTYTSDGKKIDTHLQYYISNISYKLLPDGYGDEKTSVIF